MRPFDPPGVADDDSRVADLSQRRAWTFLQRHGLLAVGLSAVVANVVGSAFNIAYNHYQIVPFLDEQQMALFEQCWQWFNLAVYPVAIAMFATPLFWLRPLHRDLIAGKSVDAKKLSRAQRYVVNLPWWFLMVIAIGWLSCIPVFPYVLSFADQPLSSQVFWHLMVSFVIASMIALTHSFFALELTIQKVLFPVFFRRENPASVPGGVPLNITARGVMWAISAVVCPIVSLLLLLVLPHEPNVLPIFASCVSFVAISFGLVTSWMLGTLIATPVRQLQDAATRVADGDYDVRVHLLRSDDFGLLIERFNRMVEGLRQREVLQETFGRHVGESAAAAIMKEDTTLVGRSQSISVMFVDVRNFTATSSKLPPEQVVAAINVFFEKAVECVEANGGLLNKFLGDGFMAIFGIGANVNVPNQPSHADQAVKTGLELLRCVADSEVEFAAANWPGLRIGVGVNSGDAVVGSIGSPRRQEYTAIGDTVNVAARAESLTKAVGYDFVITESTRQLLVKSTTTKQLTPQSVKGKLLPLEIHAVIDTLERG